MRRTAAMILIVISLAAAGIASATVQPRHHHPGPSCYTTCASRTDLGLSSYVLTYGNEQVEVFTATVRPRFEQAPGTPTGTVSVQTYSTFLCNITLAGGAGSCSPASTVLAARHRPYFVSAYYSGDSNFLPSVSRVQPLEVSNPQTGCGHHHHRCHRQGW